MKFNFNNGYFLGTEIEGEELLSRVMVGSNFFAEKSSLWGFK